MLGTNKKRHIEILNECLIWRNLLIHKEPNFCKICTHKGSGFIINARLSFSALWDLMSNFCLLMFDSMQKPKCHKNYGREIEYIF